MTEMESGWLDTAEFEGPYVEKNAVTRLLALGLKPDDLVTYGLLFAIPLVGRPDSGCVVIAESSLGNVYRAAAWICTRMRWGSSRTMMGRCFVVNGHVRCQDDLAHYPSCAPADPDLFNWAMRNAGVMIARDPGVRIYGGSISVGIGGGSRGFPVQSDWDVQRAAENGADIQERKQELGLA